MNYAGIFSSDRRDRVGFLDEMRGLCIILMVIYHGIFSVVYVFGWDIVLPSGTRFLSFVFNSLAFRFAQPFVAGIFIFISGIACRYSRSNFKRGLIALAIALAVSVVTIYILPLMFPGYLAIYFGILHFMGTSMILFALLNRALDKLSPGIGLVICMILFALTYNAKRGFIGIYGLWEIALPALWATNGWLIPIGFAAGGADHFPLLPWLFLFFAGSYLGVAFVKREMPAFFYRSHSRFFAAAGKRTIIIYVLHQPAIFGVLYTATLISTRLAG